MHEVGNRRLLPLATSVVPVSTLQYGDLFDVSCGISKHTLVAVGPIAAASGISESTDEAMP